MMKEGVKDDLGTKEEAESLSVFQIKVDFPSTSVCPLILSDEEDSVFSFHFL